MNPNRRKEPWYVFVFVMALILLLSPVISVFDVSKLVFGLPVSSIYVFAVWLGIIVLMAFISKKIATHD